MVSPGLGCGGFPAAVLRQGFLSKPGGSCHTQAWFTRSPDPGHNRDRVRVWEPSVECRPLRLAGKGWQETGSGLGQLWHMRTPVESFMYCVPATCQALCQALRKASLIPTRVPTGCHFFPLQIRPQPPAHVSVSFVVKRILGFLYLVLVLPFNLAIPCTITSPDGSCQGPQRLPHC